MLAIFASGATFVMIPAQAVPWPARSPSSTRVNVTFDPSTFAPTSSTIRPASSGCAASTPLSMIATVTPRPVAWSQSRSDESLGVGPLFCVEPPVLLIREFKAAQVRSRIRDNAFGPLSAKFDLGIAHRGKFVDQCGYLERTSMRRDVTYRTQPGLH